MLRRCRIIILGIALLLLTGCWDSLDIDKRSIITAVGVGKEKDFTFVLEIASLFKGSQDVKSSRGGAYLITAKGKTFNEARNDLNQKIPFPTFLGATRVVIFDKNSALEGIEPYLNRINKFYDYRKTILITLADANLEELLSIKPDNQLSAGFNIESMVMQRYDKKNIPYVTLTDLISSIAFGDIGYVVSCLSIENEKVRISGMAVFNEKSELIDILNTKEARGLSYILLDNAENHLDISHKEKRNGQENIIQFKTILKKHKIKTEYKEGKVLINVDLKFDAYLMYQYYILKILPEDKKIYEKDLEEKIKGEIMKLIEKSQNEYKCDIFEFAKYFKAQNINDYRKLNWKSEYPEAIITVNVDVKYSEENNMDYTVDYYKD